MSALDPAALRPVVLVTLSLVGAAAVFVWRIRETMSRRDTVGGLFMVAATGVPVGLGSHVHWDRKLDGRLAAALMSIHAIKGVEIGSAFENARKFGTEVHDEFSAADGDHAGARRSNRAGGLEGGMTNGQPVVLRAAMKPISTTLTPLQSINMQTGEAAATNYTRSLLTIFLKEANFVDTAKLMTDIRAYEREHLTAQHIRLGFAGHRETELAEAVRRLAVALGRVRGASGRPPERRSAASLIAAC